MTDLLWLDDLRNPYLNTELKVPHQLIYENIVWVRNYEEFTSWINKHGLPKNISFDHDLGDSHYTPEKYWTEYEVSKLWQDLQEHTEKTGLDCMKWLVNYILDNNTDKADLPRVYVHSANPVGADNIRNLWNNFNKFRNKL